WNCEKKGIAVCDTMDRDDLLFSYKGILYPTTVCSPETFKALESFEARQEDVILAGYPKSGEYNLFMISRAIMCPFPSLLPHPSRANFEIIPLVILLLVRNLKDTAVSYFHFYNNMPTLPSFASFPFYIPSCLCVSLCSVSPPPLPSRQRLQ
uniref:Sulfotransferase n=1 Tax=Terrapene triunguis TaxID=2587831 RepID=A0A674K858_9SAUR